MRPAAQADHLVQTLGRPARTMTTTTMHIQATRPFWLSGAVVPVGTVLSLPTILAAELVHNGKATACAAPAAAAETPAITPAAPAVKAKAAPKAPSPKPPEATP